MNMDPPLEKPMNESDKTVTALIKSLEIHARADAEFQHISRWSNFTVQGQCPDNPTAWVRVEAGTITHRLSPAHADLSSPDAGELIVLRGSVSAWCELRNPNASPRRHDLLALTKAADGIQIIEGRLSLIRHLRVLSRLVELGREHG